MKLSRRAFLSGVCFAALLNPAFSQFNPTGFGNSGFGSKSSSGSPIPIGTGWNTLPLGCGGLPTGINIANDGSMVCRTDVGNIYRWSGKTTDYNNPSYRWIPLMTYAGLGSTAKISQSMGGWEHVLAPNNSNIHLAIFGDIAGIATKGWVYYGTWDGSKVLWNQSNLSFLNSTVESNGNPGALYKNSFYKIAVDPANENVAYCGMPFNSGNSAGAYTTLNQSGGSSLSTWASVKISGATPISAVASGVSCGLAFDPTQGTTVVGGQTVTKHIIIPVGGAGIFESVDGGVTFTEIAIAAFGSSNFYITNGGFNSSGAYFCVSVSSVSGVFGIWRYVSGTWTRITASPMWTTSGNYVPTTTLIIKPTDPNYLSVVGPNGIGYGFTTNNAMDVTPIWSGSTGGARTIVNKAASYDIGYINYIFGQNNPPGVPSAVFSLIVSAQVDPLTGILFKTGNQSIYYATASAESTVGIGPPTFNSTGPDTFMQSIGRGMEVTIAQDTLCPPGGTYPILACQDLGSPMRGTFTTYPEDMVVRYLEYTCENLEYAANDPSFIVGRATGQAGSFADVSSYSPNYGADGTWTQIAGTPTALWQGAITATISNGAGGAGTILDVSSISGQIFPGALICGTSTGGNPQYGRVQPFGTSGTTGTGGVGTYILDTTSTLLTPTSIFSVMVIQGGQTVAVDKDHWITVPASATGTTNSYQHIPAYTTNATGAATWALCNGLPATNWMRRPWTFGFTPKPLAVGYGSDLGTVWACIFDFAGTARLYRSTDSGANFSQIASWSVTTSIAAGGAPIVLSVPGFPNELWISGGFSGGSPVGVWHITNANTSSATVTAVTPLPADANLPKMLTLGAPATPGGYPTLYYVGQTVGSPNSAFVLYEGQWNGSTVTWSKFGSTGTQQDLPPSCQLLGINSIRADWNVYRRIYIASIGSGFAYYNPV